MHNPWTYRYIPEDIPSVVTQGEAPSDNNIFPKVILQLVLKGRKDYFLSENIISGKIINNNDLMFRLFPRFFCQTFAQFRHLLVKVQTRPVLLQYSDSTQIFLQDSEEPLFHHLMLRQLYRDPPQQTSEEIQLNNEATERARAGITKAWKGSEDEVKEAERKILQKQYADMVAPGQHTGGTNLLTGHTDNYFVTDLPPRDDLTNACNFMSCDNEGLRQAHTMMKAASSPRLSRKINV